MWGPWGADCSRPQGMNGWPLRTADLSGGTGQVFCLSNSTKLRLWLPLVAASVPWRYLPEKMRHPPSCSTSTPDAFGSFVRHHPLVFFPSVLVI